MSHLLKLLAALAIVLPACRSTDRADEASAPKAADKADAKPAEGDAAAGAKTKVIDCKVAPISDCCSDDDDACRQCRDAAAEEMVAWKDQCGAVEAFSCDKKPALAECCTQTIPSCTTCRDRNRRAQEDWDRRCK